MDQWNVKDYPKTATQDERNNSQNSDIDHLYDEQASELFVST